MRSATKNRVGKDPKYLAFLHTLPCIVPECSSKNLHKWDDIASARIEAAHVGDRGLSQKCPDREALPACIWHHRTGPESLHRLGAKFWTRWGLDRAALIAKHQRLFEEGA